MDKSLSSCIDLLLKFATSVKQSEGNSVSSCLLVLNELKEKFSSYPELPPLLKVYKSHDSSHDPTLASQCLDWTLYLTAALTQLEQQLSVSQEKSVHSLLTLLVCLGIRPNLLINSQSNNAKQKDMVDPSIKHSRLVVSVVLLLRIIFKSPLGPGLVQRHLLDLLAALCQLCFSPLAEATTKISYVIPHDILSEALEKGSFKSFAVLINTLGDTKDQSSQELAESIKQEMQQFSVHLVKLQNYVYQPLLVQTLLTLQSSKGKRTPLRMRKCCGEMLSSALLKQPSGLKDVLQGMLQDLPPGTASIDVPDLFLGRCQAVARILSQTPAQCSSPQEYLSLIAPQIIQLLDKSGSCTERAMSRVACSFLANVKTTQPELAQQYLFEPLLEPLLLLLDEESLSLYKDDQAVLSSKELEKCIQTLCKVFESCGDGTDILATALLLPVSNLLFELLSACGTSHLRQKTSELLRTLVKSFEELEALDWLESVLRIRSLNVTFQRNSLGGMDVIKTKFARCVNDLVAVEARAETVWILVKDAAPLQAPFFTRLLQKLTNEQAKATGSTDVFIILLLVEKMSEEIEIDQLLKDTKQAARILQSMLSCFLKTAEQVESVMEVHEENTETPLLALTLLSLLLQHQILCTEDWQNLQCLLDTLEELSHHKSLMEGTRSLAQKLRVTIATRGAVPQGHTDSNPSHTDGKDEETFECAWQFMLNPDVAMKCHGLVLVRRLFLKRDPETLQQKQLILKTLQAEHLLHKDSCVYQAAIQALVAVACFSLKEVLPLLTATFMNTEIPEETRVKIAEAIVIICRQNHVLLSPREQLLLLESFLIICRESSSLMKISALSCLADICKIMRFSICYQLQEILLCITSLLQCHGELEVKRAAAMALTYLLRGLGKDLFQALKDELRDLHRALCRSQQTESDDTLLLHVHLALEEIKEAVRQSLSDKNTMEKHIHVLDPF